MLDTQALLGGNDAAMAMAMAMADITCTSMAACGPQTTRRTKAGVQRFF